MAQKVHKAKGKWKACNLLCVQVAIAMHSWKAILRSIVVASSFLVITTHNHVNYTLIL